MLDSDETATTSLLASLAKNTVNVTEIGTSDSLTDSDDALYGSIYGKKEA